MKKILRIVITMVMVMCLAATVAFADNSKTYTVETKGATDKNGNAITVTAKETTVTITPEEAAKIINDSKVKAKNLTVAYIMDLSVPEGTLFPVKIIFNISGVGNDQGVYVFHWNGSVWELVGEGTGSSVEATFNSLSPVAIVVQNASTSYNTGAADYAPLAIMVILIAIAAAGFVYKREA